MDAGDIIFMLLCIFVGIIAILAVIGYCARKRSGGYTSSSDDTEKVSAASQI